MNGRNEEILKRLELAQTEVINSVKETKKLTLEKESIQASLNELKENYLRKEEELVDVSFLQQQIPQFSRPMFMNKNSNLI